MSRRRWRVSVLILVVLGFQAVPVAREWTGAHETLWPFLAWGMFRHSSEPPLEAEVYRILATTEDGARPVGPAEAGLDPFAFRRLYQIAIAEGDTSATVNLARRLGERWRTPVREIVLEKRAFRLSDGEISEVTTVQRFDMRLR